MADTEIIEIISKENANMEQAFKHLLKIKNSLLKNDFTAAISHVDKLIQNIGIIENNVKEIEKSKKELEKVFDELPIPISIHDKDYNIIRANSAMKQMLNASYCDIIGKKCYKILHETGCPPKNCPLSRAKKYGEAVSETKNNYLHKKGSFVTVVKRLPGDDDLYLHIIKDVTTSTDIAKQVIEAVEKEKKDLSERVHDNLLQVGFSVMMYCQSVEHKACTKENKEKLHLAVRNLEKMLSEGRNIIKDLQPPVLESIGLKSAIKEYAREIFEGHPIIINIAGSKLPRLTPELKATIFRIAQEALTNVLKHSKATRVDIAINQKKDKFLEVVIKDNGIGLPENYNRGNSHIGTKLMKERAETQEGYLSIGGKQGKGVEVYAVFPLNMLDRLTQADYF
jgi:two-component sensor histidine kinase